jgi:DNA-binding SARP family transcriptional activator
VYSLSTLGGLSIVGPDGASTGLAPRRRALALLTLAASSTKDGISRDQAMGLLWPELDAANARNNLKQTVFAIRHTLGVDVFDSTTPNLRLDARQIAVDLHHFERALAVGAHDDAVADYAGPFLDGFFLPNLIEFERWVERVRQRLALGYARALESLAVKARLGGDMAAAVHWYRRLVGHDPLSTTSVLGLLSTLAEASEPLEALEVYRLHRKLIKEEFDAEPDRKLVSAAERVRQRLSYRPSGPNPVMADDGELPTMPPIFAEPQRTTRRTSGPASSPEPPKVSGRSPLSRWLGEARGS